MDILGVAAQDIVGIVLLAGVLSAMLAAGTPEYSGLDRSVWNLPTREHLQMIGPNRRAWRWASATFGAAGLFNALGIGLLSLFLPDPGSRFLAEAALLIYFAGALLWMAVMAFRMGVEPWAADVMAETSTVPAVLEAYKPGPGSSQSCIWCWAIAQRALSVGRCCKQPSCLPGLAGSRW